MSLKVANLVWEFHRTCVAWGQKSVPRRGAGESALVKAKIALGMSRREIPQEARR